MLLNPFRTMIGRLLTNDPHDLPKHSAGNQGLCISTAQPPLRGLFRFAVLCSFIGAVSVHDAYLVLHNRQTILEHEKNPIGRWMIELGGGEVTLFVSVKLTTTAAVCSLLIWMYRRRPQQTECVTMGVAAFQLGLLLYLLGAWT